MVAWLELSPYWLGLQMHSKKETDKHSIMIKTFFKALAYLKAIHLQNHLIFKQNQTIIMNQQEALQAMQDLKAELVKIQSETQSLLTKIDALQNAANNAAELTPELSQAISDVVAQAKVVDDLVPDSPPTQG